MRWMKQIVVGGCLLAGVFLANPAHAQSAGSSDTSGTNATTGPASTYGGFSNSGSVGVILQGLVEQLNQLLGGTASLPGKGVPIALAPDSNLEDNSVGAGVKQQAGDDLSPEARAAVKSFRDELKALLSGKVLIRSDKLQKLLDSNLRNISYQLSKDISAAKGDQLARLTTRTTKLLDALDKLSVELSKAVAIGSAF